MIAEPQQLDFSPGAWDAWTPRQVAGRLAGCPARWAVVGGWAIDLFLGEQRRPHGDLEIIVPMWEFDSLRDRFPDVEMFVAGREGFWPLGAEGEAFFEYQQTMVRDPASLKWKLDIMRSPDDGTHWTCTLDRTLRRPWHEAVRRDRDGIPYLAPELTLLHKAATGRPKDERDLRTVLPHLPAADRTWLRHTVERLMGEKHPWVAVLADA